MTEPELYVRVRASHDTAKVMLHQCYETYEDRLRLEQITKNLSEILIALDRKELKV